MNAGPARIAKSSQMTIAPPSAGSSVNTRRFVSRSANATRREIDHASSVFPGDKTGSGCDDLAAAGKRQRLDVFGEEHDGQIALQILLLIDGEQHAPIAHGFEYPGREIEGREFYLAIAADLLQRSQCGFGTRRPKREHGVERRCRAQRA